MRETFHLVPTEVWRASDVTLPYEPASLDSEGFVHCTDGTKSLIATANRHFVDDPRDFTALTIDLERTGSPWRIEDDAGIYPHVYGPIDRIAIVALAPVSRDGDGRFLALGDTTTD
jgi:uncharacterized protein (DUF952 family)